jgi:hypothetical protein
MKFRNGFVSNSSSSSFCLYKKLPIVEKNLDKIKELIDQHNETAGGWGEGFIGEDGNYFLGTLNQHEHQLLRGLADLEIPVEDVGNYC